MSFFEKINSQVSSGEDAAKGLVEVVIKQLTKVVRKRWLADFSKKVFSIESEISKGEILKQAIKVFQDAQDTETIVEHMTEPIELEKRLIKEKYLRLQQIYAEEVMKGFDKAMSGALRTCQ